MIHMIPDSTFNILSICSQMLLKTNIKKFFMQNNKFPPHNNFLIKQTQFYAQKKF